MSEPFVIVGGGISGLLTASFLLSREVPFLGFEKEERFGGKLAIGHHRLYDKKSSEILSGFASKLEWLEVSDVAKSRRKGEWVVAEPGEDWDENFLLRSPFYQPSVPFSRIIEDLREEVGSYFQLSTAVTKVDAENSTIELQNGQIQPFSKLVWCTDLQLLSKVYSGDKGPLAKLMKKNADPRRAINLDLELKAPVIEAKNTIVFPFRFKESKLKAFGVSAPAKDHGQTLHWLLYLEEEFADDHEEVAKCVRTLKREIEKEFPEIKENLVAERIFFLPSAASQPPVYSKSTEILPNIFYLGPQVSFSESDEEERNLDIVLKNVVRLQQSLAQ